MKDSEDGVPRLRKGTAGLMTTHDTGWKVPKPPL